MPDILSNSTGAHLYNVILIIVEYLALFGPVIIVEWSQALPLTACCLTAAQVHILAGACEKVASDLGLGSVFLAGSTVSSTTYNWLVTIWVNYG